MLSAKENFVETLAYKGKGQLLSEFLQQQLLTYGKYAISNLIEKNKVIVNNKRISKDCMLCNGDKIDVLVSQESLLAKKDIFVKYKDDNILVAIKPVNMEVELSSNGTALIDYLQQALHIKLYAVHRIDRNTTGLVVFATNAKSKEQLDIAFKNRTIIKRYYALVVGNPKRKESLETAYLFKDSKKALCYVSDTPKKGYLKIVTKYKTIKSINGTSLLDIELITGKTHQIRAHLSHIGLPIVGDTKYGNGKYNNSKKIYKQKLMSYYLKFTNLEEPLKYLNNFEIELEQQFI